VGTNVIRTNSVAVNTWRNEIQRSTTASTSTVASNGVSHFNSANFTVDTNAFVTAKAGFQPGVSNLGITYSGSTFSITAADGSALSSSNPAFVTLSSKTAGILKTITVTANQSFIDATGASTISGNLFGLTAGVAATNAIPFFIYAVLNDAETAIAFMVSRYPNTRVSPIAANIGQSGSAIADTQGSFFSLTSITATDYDSNPCICIGSFRMTMSAGNDWTVTALDVSDGIGCFQENRAFTWGTGLWGAAAGSFFYNNGGTAPTFTDIGIGYYVDRMNQFQTSVKLVNCNGAGVGAVSLQLALPFSINADACGSSRLVNAAGLVFSGCSALQPSGPNNKIITYSVNDASSLVILNNNVTVSATYAISYFVRAMIDFS